ncbi:MAG: DNA mismatch repair protein MutS [Rhodospirillaceae bacterium]|jgi:DNA-nicking Smr family endonuclease|nr:DNA mismatch repair protein MutS [Rhodospirillaceae bacterium]MBT4687892.1 DNA mismatch repair protein MutS [Rhodospirillaceae bacterium]MBT5083150.1 DNA mismatch repair protein MutS [Rhodospirillaceae bacterium]MBT5523350.1 DNA mismatch repair protein MutS [Rhodospirillaceae bacterium]MBT5877535.1 DNA mismatch repair protein MutS [Rhodospirillaceae bacterium]
MTKPGKKHKVAIDDAALFEAAVRDAEPLKGRPSRPPRIPPKTAARPAGTRTGAKPVKAARPAIRHSVAKAPLPVNANGDGGLSSGLDKRSAERLRRGQMVIDARLDLHGHTQADAHRAVHAFVAAGYRSGKRCVLIITGKGGPRDDFDSGFMPDRDSGVLRRNLPRWLGEPAVRNMILRLQSARPQHGGEGAYYVLLRRKR